MDRRLILGLTLREHIGGRWAISWQVFVLNMPFNVIGVATVMATPPTGRAWLEWLLVALVGVGVIALFFIIGGLTWLRRRREHPVPVWSVALWGGLIGGVRAWVVVGTAESLGLLSPSAADTGMRVVWGALLGAVALPMGALVLSSIFRFRHERERLLAEKAEAERRRMQREGEVETLREALVEGVRGEVRETLDEVESELLTAREASEALRRTSHRIWSPEDEAPGSGTPVISVLRASFAPHRVPALGIAGLWTLFAVPPLVSGLGLGLAVICLAYSFVALWACFAAADRWARRRPDRWWWGLAGAGATGWVLVSPVSYLVFDRRPLGVAGPVQAVNAVWLALLVLLMTFLSGALASSEAVLRRLSEDLDDAEVAARAQGEVRDLILRELAARLHGSVQSPMVSGLALLEAQKTGEQERAHLIQQVGLLVATLGDEAGDRSLEDGLAEALVPWRGYLETDVVLEPGLESLAREDRRIVERVVEEGVVNAYRHGGATRAVVTVVRQPSGLLVQICDNGRGLPRASTPGLGSRFFSAVACGAWTLTAQPGGGCRLEVPLAVRSTPTGGTNRAH